MSPGIKTLILGKKNNIANLLLNVFMLCGIIVFAIVAGVAFGGIRILFNRFSRSRFCSAKRRRNSSPCTCPKGYDGAPDSKRKSIH